MGLRREGFADASATMSAVEFEHAAVLDRAAAQLAESLLDDHPTAATALIDGARASGLGVERLLIATARHSGLLWCQDRMNFVDVTLLVSRLKRLYLQALRPSLPWQGQGSGSLLIASVPGDQHDFGLMMVANSFQQAGFAVDFPTGATESELIYQVAGTRYDVIGLSLATEDLLVRLPMFIRLMRNRSKNKNVLFLVGGNAFRNFPERARAVGADFVANDPATAVLLALAHRDRVEARTRTAVR
jgi:methylmalonyl-CoA mutase cobalamin-binding domain/chain